MNCKDLSVSGFLLRIESDRQIEVTESFRQFLAEGGKHSAKAEFRCVAELPRMPERILNEDSVSRVCMDEKGKFIRFFYESPEAELPYAAAFEEPEGTIQVQYLPEGAHRVSQVQNCVYHIGLEPILIRQNRMFLHAACVRTSMGGLLFSGRSGIGKSTQADLWCSFRNATLINGDRPILAETEGSWQAWGAPYAGSSRCHVNESCPVTAIFMLRQAKECALRRLSAPEAFRAIWSGLTVQSWDRFFVERASDLALKLIETVPVFEFSCTPDEGAVVFLEQALGKELGL